MPHYLFHIVQLARMFSKELLNADLHLFQVLNSRGRLLDQRYEGQGWLWGHRVPGVDNWVGLFGLYLGSLEVGKGRGLILISCCIN